MSTPPLAKRRGPAPGTVSVRNRDTRPGILPGTQPAIKWTGTHRQAVLFEMVGGMSREQIGKALNRSKVWVSQTLGDPRAQVDRDEIMLTLARTAPDVHAGLKLAAKAAFDELLDELEDADVKVRHKSAVEILDRGGYSRYQGSHVPAPQLSEQVAGLIVATMGELARLPRQPMYSIPAPVEASTEQSGFEDSAADWEIEPEELGAEEIEAGDE